MRKRDLERVSTAAARAKLARVQRDAIIRELHKHYSVRAIAEAAGLSHSRVGQIVKEMQDR